MSLSGFSKVGRKIVAVGRNYADHAKELGNALPSKPLLFMKPTSSYITAGQSIEIPLGCSELHHEIELGAIINNECKAISEAQAMNFVGGYCLALDMTARDFQDEAKKKGHPWAMAKMFDTSLPVSDVIPLEKIPDPANVQLWCKVNEEMRQNGCTADMIFSLPYLISYISHYFTLQKGDLILTGTPAGVGPVKAGDVITGGIPDVIDISFNVTQRS
eukprot:TRINITY_DN66075_c0_g1_i1.p1 TRINITY_DN66075_c0_g1~~TRINITY_DN66075_c0_g1_i1.p1  ORF type:complete len:228 (-),score=25.77 TRINITY_DN66075_c0_g1_i1:66-716(-)